MGKVFRRVASFSLLFLVSTFFLSFFISIKANEVTVFGGASYYVESRKETNELQGNVLQYTDISYSQAAGTNGFLIQQVNVLEVPSSKEVSIVPWSTMSQANWNLSTVKLMAKSYEKLNPGFKVIGAVNGDFFDINSNREFPKTPSGAHVSGGEYYKSSGGSAISFINDGSTNTLIGNATPTRTSSPMLAIYDENNEIIKEVSINQLNSSPADGELAVYFATWEFKPGVSTQKITPINVEDAIIVKNGEYSLPISKSDFYGKGVITMIGSSELSTGDFAVVSKNSEITELLTLGVKIRVQYEFTGLFKGATNVIGVGETLLYNNEYKSTDVNRHPRTMVGVKDDGTIVMTVVDGRQAAQNMNGVTGSEMAAILKHYGCRDGYNLDGGGSSTLIILDQGEFRVMNSPSDGNERSDANCLLIVIKVPDIDITYTRDTSQITLNVDLIDQNEIEFSDLYLEINGEKKKVENKQVSFSNLESNTTYLYKALGFRDGEYRDLFIEGVITTLKITPELSDVWVRVVDIELHIYVEVFDPDVALVHQSVSLADNIKNIPEVSRRTIFIIKEDTSINDVIINLSYKLSADSERVNLAFEKQINSCPVLLLLNSVKADFKKSTKSLFAN